MCIKGLALIFESLLCVLERVYVRGISMKKAAEANFSGFVFGS